MARKINMEQAANRHYFDGTVLMAQRRFDNAGYHFGLAAECAVKRALQDVGVRGDDEAIWRHFPDITPSAIQAIEGRRAAPLRTLLETSAFMRSWHVAIRYSQNGTIDEVTATAWRNDANTAIGLII